MPWDMNTGGGPGGVPGHSEMIKTAKGSLHLGKMGKPIWLTAIVIIFAILLEGKYAI